MARLPRHTLLLILGLPVVSAAPPGRVYAQLVRQGTTTPGQQAATGQNSMKSQTSLGKKRLSQEVQITGDASWMDTGVDVQPGEHVVMSATGKLRYSDAKEDNGPDGLTRGFRDLLRVLPLNDAGRGALIGRIGDKDAAQPFLVGAHCDVVAPITGRLALGINQESKDPATGTYVVLIEVYAPADGEAHVVVAKSIASIPGIDNGLFSKIPRRVSDKQGHPGDMVNLLILGSASAMRNAFLAAGWVQVDADVKDAVLHGIIESMSHESYLNMPMSQLYLFGRPQDYGWAHAEPLYVAKS